MRSTKLSSSRNWNVLDAEVLHLVKLGYNTPKDIIGVLEHDHVLSTPDIKASLKRLWNSGHLAKVGHVWSLNDPQS